MNVVYPNSTMVVAKTCGRRDGQKVTYAFASEFHTLCMDKKDIIRAEVEACEKLLRYSTQAEKAVIEKEIEDLKTALDFMS